MTTEDDSYLEFPISLHQLENVSRVSSIGAEVYNRSHISQFLDMTLVYNVIQTDWGII